MNEKLFKKVNQLPMDYPGINLMEKDSVTTIEDFCEHALYYWIT